MSKVRINSIEQAQDKVALLPEKYGHIYGCSADQIGNNLREAFSSDREVYFVLDTKDICYYFCDQHGHVLSNPPTHING